jgi:hypothetical protein
MSTKTQKVARSGRKANPQEIAQVEPVIEPSEQDAPVAPESAQVSKGRGKRTLADVADGYLAHLEDAEKSPGTVFSYRMDLKAALDHFGADTLVSTLTPAKVSAFFASDGVTKKRNGKKKSSITVAKTQRVFRLAMDWAAEKGLIGSSPVPVEARPHGKAKAEAARPARTKKDARKATKAIESATNEPAPEPANQPPAA